MSSYLLIAEKVLRETREPMSAKQIMDAAYKLQIVPRDLYGKAQHKTLHARISVDIQRLRSGSRFARVAPGRFVLSNTNIRRGGHQRRTPTYIAPARSDQLRNYDVLCFDRSVISALPVDAAVRLKDLRALPHTFCRLSKVSKDRQFYFVQVFAVISCRSEIVIHRAQRDVDHDLSDKISIGITTAVKRDDNTLFSDGDLGVRNAADRAIMEKMYVPRDLMKYLKLSHDVDNSLWVMSGEAETKNNSCATLLILLELVADSPLERFFEKAGYTERRSCIYTINDLSRFDAWSKDIIESRLIDVLCSQS